MEIYADKKLERAFNKIHNLIKILYEDYNGNPFADNEKNKLVKDLYNTIYPAKKTQIDNNDELCKCYRPNAKSVKCWIYAKSDIDGESCKSQCDWYKKTGHFSYRS